MMAISIEQVSAKVRSGGPKDDPADLASEIWAGVIPIEETRGDPVPAPDLGAAIGLPDYLRTHLG